jgi:hypothetical protein
MKEKKDKITRSLAFLRISTCHLQITQADIQPKFAKELFSPNRIN